MSPLPLVLDGETLGQKHKYYNYIVRKAIADEAFELERINYDDKDIDNLFKIDVACGRRDIAYVLEVIKGGDALYVAHALKRSAWLLAGDEYAHVINPHYLQREIFPKTTNAAKNKMLLAIRLNLKNETRVDEFYNFYKEDFKFTQKWLPHCSEPLVISVIEKEATQINDKLMKRLCKKSFAILEACCDARPSPHWLKCGKTFLYTDTEQYLELINTVEHEYVPKFGKKATRFIMNKCPDRILDHFHKYCYKIDLCEFSKHFNTEAIRDFLSKQMVSDHYEVRSWCKHKYVKHLIRQIPEKNRFKFVRQKFLDRGKRTNKDYSWYRYVPFETAFTKMKDLIFKSKYDLPECAFSLMESLNSAELTSKECVQVWALKILVRSTRGNLNDIQTLIRHYRDNHNIEPYDDPISSILCKLTKTYRYDETTWNMLNDIFYSMGIYRDDRNIIIPYCIQAIVLYNIIHDKHMPKVIEKQIKLSNFRTASQKLDLNEKQKVFTYLYNYASTELVNKEVNNETDVVAALSMCDELLKFLKDWKRNVTEYPLVVNKINELIKVKNENLRDTDSGSEVNKMFSRLYKEHKCLKIHLFKESLSFCLNDETCLNMLKHNPDLLLNLNLIKVLTSNGAVSCRRTLMKLRIYWPNSIVKQWADVYRTALDQPPVPKSCVEGLFILLPRKDALIIVDKYAPLATEIKSEGEIDKKLSSMTKNVARYMHLVRPLVSLDAVLMYADEKCFKFIAPLLEFILAKTSHDKVSPYVTKLLYKSGAPQKLGIRYILKVKDTTECKHEIMNVWNQTTSNLVQSGLFEYIYKLLVDEKETLMIAKLWGILGDIFDYLTSPFYTSVETKLQNIKEVPELVRQKFFMKSFNYLISHPELNDETIDFSSRCYYMRCYVDQLEIDFLEKVLAKILKAIEKYFNETRDSSDLYYLHHTDFLRVLTAFLTTNDSIDSQIIKFEKIFVPLIQCFLKVLKPNESYIYDEWNDCRVILRRFLESLCLNVSKRLTKEYIIPTTLFKNIQNSITDAFPLDKEYYLITYWNIAVLFVEKLDKFSKNDIFQGLVGKITPKEHYIYTYSCPIFEEIYLNIAPEFGKSCIDYLKRDNIISTNPSLYPLVSKSLMSVFISLSFPYSVMYKTMKHMLQNETSDTYYLVVVGVIRCMYQNAGYGDYVYFEDVELKKIILSHPSRAVRTHYHHIAANLSGYEYSETENVCWRRSGFMPTSGPNDLYLY